MDTKEFNNTRFHANQWNLALEAGKEKAAEMHQREYLNYSARVEEMKEKGAG
tara:strand:- start:2684 stop:2839 length:156 start_codon:yes stop_codon:yes gene_type:complete